MRIADRIAKRILEDIEEKTGKNFTKKQYLDLECKVGDILKEELNKWLGYDTDLNFFEDSWVYIEKEKFFWNEKGYLEHKESKTTFNDVAEAKKWIDRILIEMRNEGGIN